MSSVERTIVRTIVYFDLFSYPLTELEIWKWQYHNEEFPISNFQFLNKSQIPNLKSQKFELIEIVEALEKSDVLKRLLGHRDGVYFLRGREEIVEERKKRYVISDQKLKRARKWMRVLQYMPFIEAIAVCNSLGYHNGRASSDIDLFVVTTPKRVWTARFFFTGLLKLFYLRPESGHTADGICPSFFASSIALNMEPFAMKPFDPYLLFWTTQVTPFTSRGLTSDHFTAANVWVKESLPAALLSTDHPQTMLLRGSIGKIAQPCIEWVLRAIPTSERLLRALQYRIMPDRLSRLSREAGSGVFLSDDVLKFHEHDRREYFRQQFEARYHEITNA